MSVIQQVPPDSARSPSQVDDAYAHYRLDRQGDPVSPNTLELYEHTVGRFLRWLRTEHPDVRKFEDLKVLAVREYRAQLASRPGLRGKPIQPETLAGSDRAMRAFFRWANGEGYSVDPRILQLRKVRIPRKEPTIFHIKQLNDILAACNPRMPQEATTSWSLRLRPISRRWSQPPTTGSTPAWGNPSTCTRPQRGLTSRN